MAEGPDLEIRPATRADIPAVAEIAARIWRAHYPGIITPEQIDYMLGQRYSAEALVEQIEGEGQRLDLAIVGGALAGFAQSYVAGPDVTKLDKLYLLPELHGKGLGSRMIAHVAARARERGSTRLVLAVNKRNHKAIEAYLRNGFAIRESVVVDIGRGFVMDDHVMEKAL